MNLGQGIRAVAALLLLLPASLQITACDRRPARTAEGEGRKITLAVTPWPGSAAVYIAQEKGYFREEGLEATLRSYPSGHQGLEAVLSGKADLATVGDTPIARAAVEGRQFSVVATISEVERGVLIVARRDRGIMTSDDLRGKKIGRVAGTTADFFLDTYLKTSYLHPRDVRIVDLDPGDVVQALLEGEVDAVSTWPPYTTTLEDKLGGDVAVLHEPGLYNMTWNIIAAKDLARRDPDAIRWFLRAVLRANRLIVDRPAEARSITAANCGMDMGTVEREWDNFDFDTHLDETLLLTLEDEARWMIGKEGGRGNRTPNFADHMDTKGLMAVDPQSVRLFGD